MWSPFPLPSGRGSIENHNSGTDPRNLFSHEDYIDMVMLSGRPLTHEYEEGTTEEDPRMLAFFDSLIQRETSGWDSVSDDNFSPDEFYLTFLQGESSESENDTVGISMGRLRQALARRQATQPGTDNSQALYRRLRRLSRAAVLRQLLGGESESSSNSSDSSSGGENEEVEEESQPRVVLPDLSPTEPRSEEPVQFQRRRGHRRRHYRGIRTSSSGSSTTTSEEISLENTHPTDNEIGACSSSNCNESLTAGGLIETESSDDKIENMDVPKNRQGRSQGSTNDKNEMAATENGLAESSDGNIEISAVKNGQGQSESSDEVEEFRPSHHAGTAAQVLSTSGAKVDGNSTSLKDSSHPEAKGESSGAASGFETKCKLKGGVLNGKYNRRKF